MPSRTEDGVRPGSPVHRPDSLRILARERVQRESILGHPDPLAQHPVYYVPSARRLSASFSNAEPPSSRPTVATSSLTASKTTSTLPVPTNHQEVSRKVVPSTATTYTTASATRQQAKGNENISPNVSQTSLSTKHKDSIELAAAKLHQKTKMRTAGTIPKSRTMNVFSNLTSSISRASIPNFSRTTSTSSAAESDSGASLSSRPSTANVRPEIINPRQIHTAQPSAYWTGRFMALQDRFHSEMLLPDNLTTLVNAHAHRSIVPRPKLPSHGLATSFTNPNLASYAKSCKQTSSSSTTASPNTTGQLNARNSIDAEMLENEENRCRRVFLHLEALCTTSEAKRSLHAWQQSYARRTGKEEFLPRGGSMDDKGWMGRLLGRNGAQGAKRSSLASVA
ncbi:uncharacterized protein BCR38DRAFT_487378 [Pseudomassariella vexata]|uniref:Uncharacterized protein n=1 Tax=Pseudomassariella vexata TaxID=1141098 RepID=A0A1Y2DQT1_9PEZI|nr:uncharacterized protein BCR38DRAFT_487378 [Pseudomassariella vexata]ORY61630.1 hypothetical protein BCR38DRAFT_487378 [Pseudomassariella vexata]